MSSTALDAARRTGGDQRRQDEAGLGQQRNRGGAQGEDQEQRHHAIGADAVVAHDGEALLGRVAAEPIGEIGKPVLMQRAGGEDRGGERKERGERRRASRANARARSSPRQRRPQRRPPKDRPRRSRRAAVRGDMAGAAPAGA